MNSINGRKILLVIPKYYGYEKYIIEEFKKMNSKMFVIYENLYDINIIYKIARTVSEKIASRLIFRYYMKQFQRVVLEEIDNVIIIRGSTISNVEIQFLKKHTRDNCKYIMYQWDSINNNPHVLNYVDLFDRILTFDPEDAKRYGWDYLPLFYVPTLCSDVKERKIDFLFICSLHTKRLKILEQAIKYCQKEGYSIEYSVFVKPLIYIKCRFIDRMLDYENTTIRNVVFKPVSLEKTYKYYSNSKCVIDFTHPNQDGFTMRTIESIFSGCKLITNNQKIYEADFYNPHNIVVYNDSLDLDRDVINTPVDPMNSTLKEKYTLSRWVNKILGGQ